MAQDYFAVLVEPCSQAEAEAGSNNSKPMTALRTKQQIDVVNAGIHPLVVTQQSANSGGLWGPMDGAMIEFLGDIAYMFGGWAGATANPDWDSGIVTNLVYSTDDFGVTWQKIRDHDLTPDSTHFIACHYAMHCKHTVGDTEYIYLLGGDNNNVNSEVRRTVNGITWTLVNSVQPGWHATVLGAAGSLNGNLYVAGGFSGVTGTSDLTAANATSKVWRSTDNGQTWTDMGSAPFPPGGLQDRLVNHNGKLWRLGGEVYETINANRTYDNSVWSFDGTTWTEELADGLAPWVGRGYAKCWSQDGWMYISRGYRYGHGDSNGNLSDTWRSRDGKKWLEVHIDLFASHADAVGVHATGVLVGPGNALLTNNVNTNSASYFIEENSASELADGIAGVVSDYVGTNAAPAYKGLIEEGYTEGTEPRVLLGGNNLKLCQRRMPHYTASEEKVTLDFGYSTSDESYLFLGGGINGENACTEIRVSLGETNTTLTGTNCEKIRVAGHSMVGRLGVGTTAIPSSHHLDVFGKFIRLGGDTGSNGGRHTSATIQEVQISAPTYTAGNFVNILNVWAYDTNQTPFYWGGGNSGLMAATEHHFYVGVNGTTAVGVEILGFDLSKVRVERALELATYTTGTRPVATTLRAGACIYDTTLGIPIYSNASVWKDAAGTTV